MQKRRSTMLAAASLSMMLAGISVLSACSSGGNEATTTDGVSSSAPAKAGNLKIEIWDRGNAPEGVTITNSFLTNYIRENFGKPNNIHVEFVPVPRSEEVSKLNILMASNSDVPDIVMTYDAATFNKYASQGGLTEVTELLKEHGPNISRFLGEDILKFGQYKGQQFSIPAKRSTTGKYASFIRQDWLDKLNLKAPNTTEDLYNVLKAFKEKDPGETGGKVIPLGMTIAPAQYEPLIWSFIDTKISEQERFELTQTLASRDYPILLPGFKDAVQFMNKLYNEGLISQDFALDKKKETLHKDITNGRVGFFSEDNINIFYNEGTYDTLKKNNPSAVLTPIDAYSNKDGKHTKPISAPNGMYIMIPKASKSAVEAVKYLDWMASGDHLITILKGVRGQNYELDSNGIPYMLDNQSDSVKNNLYSGGDLGIISNGLSMDTQDKSNEAFIKNFPERFHNDARNALIISSTDAVPQLSVPRPIEAESKYGTTLLEKAEELIVKATMVKPAEFDAVFESMMKAYMSSGGQAVLDERKVAWKEMSAK